MKVLFDHQLFSYQRFGGASKYFAELLANMPRECWETTTIFSNNQYVKDLGLFESKHLFPNKHFYGQGRIMNELNKPHSAKILRQQNFDVFHQTHFETYCLKPLKDKPMVTTFHDINFSTINYNPKIVALQEKSLARANRIICVSENTKKDMIGLFNIPEEKVCVVHHGIEHTDLSILKTERVFDFKYIFYVGVRCANKNWDNFIKAFAEFAKKEDGINLVCTGKDFKPAEKENLQALGIENRVIHCSATEEQMKRLYRDAEFYIFPSLYEGFGMPLLEAMDCHTPITCANTSCFPEIAQDAALYFDPNSIDDMISSMKKLLLDSELRRKLVLKGDIRVKDFSWKKCADMHMEVYKSLI